MNYFYITGASKGIGKALAEELLKDPNNYVIGVSRNQSIQSKNYTHHPLDLSSAEQATTFAFSEHPDAEQIVLINNAGTLGEVNHLGNINNAEIGKAFNVNIVSPAILMNSFVKKYQSHSAKRLIINLTSGAAQSPYDGWSLYCAGKAAMDMLSRVAAVEQELLKSGIKILAIAPGVVDTDMQTSIRSVDESKFSRKQKFIELQSNKLLYSPQKIAEAFVSIIKNPEQVKDVVHRIVL